VVSARDAAHWLVSGGARILERMNQAVSDKAREQLLRARAHILRLRGTGPNPFDYWLWADETVQLLQAIFGADSAQAGGFADVVYERGRTRDQRGAFDNMTLGIHGEWGIRARLDRAANYLDVLLGGAGPSA